MKAGLKENINYKNNNKKLTKQYTYYILFMKNKHNLVCLNEN